MVDRWYVGEMGNREDRGQKKKKKENIGGED